MSQVKVIDPSNNKVLFETSMENIEQAYNYARDMESYGIDVEIIAPSASETLISSLGAPEEDLETLRKGLDAEIASHEGCCNQKDDD